MVVASVGEFVDQGWIAVECENDWSIFGEDRVIFGIA